MAVDKVKPLGFEEPTDGTETFPTPTELDPTEDYVAVKGIAFENEDETRVYGDSTIMMFKDGAETTPLSLSDLYGDGGSARYAVALGYNGNASSGRWLESFQSNPSNTSPIIIPEASTLKALSAGVKSSTTITFTVYKNGVALDTLVITASNYGVKTGLSYSLAAGDSISVQVTSGSCQDPNFYVFPQTV